MATAAARKYDFSGIKKRIRQEMKDSSTPSVAVAVAREGKIVWEEAFGWADLAVTTVWQFGLAVAGAVALTGILASTPVHSLFRPVLEPRGRWLVR